MFSIEELCDKLSLKIEQETAISQEQKAVIKYGLFAILHTGFALLISIVAGLLLGILGPVLIISLAGVILRKYSGGAHAEHPGECLLISLAVAAGGGWAASKQEWQLPFVIGSGIIVYIFAFYEIYRLAPVDSPAKPIRKAEKKKQLKKKSYHILGLYLMISIAFTAIYSVTGEKRFLLDIVCIEIGTLWQVFTLTSTGHRLIDGVDRLFNKLTYTRGDKKDEKN